MDLHLGCVLDFCNEVRDDLGRAPIDKLRKGEVEEAYTCPVANTINYGSRNRVEVYPSSVSLVGKEYDRGSPQCVTDFIIGFDRGDLPAFVGNGWYND